MGNDRVVQVERWIKVLRHGYQAGNLRTKAGLHQEPGISGFGVQQAEVARDQLGGRRPLLLDVHERVCGRLGYGVQVILKFQEDLLQIERHDNVDKAGLRQIFRGHVGKGGVDGVDGAVLQVVIVDPLLVQIVNLSFS